ncbi:aldehyde dehydrogenase family protein [Oceanicoccus sp. KOV_DT_Chl]|uniref:aldehyde dehydrogenase family protein n=1 Tax=Oceanicoccus sp. KOV_DT_Chl TaxID=1904639 RepID=UPI000C7AB2C8|nr:aldehyde dehydrogenase family protein [Oceanicoccus sp. KOV_DT_Chl]
MSIYEPLEQLQDNRRVLQLRSPVDLKPSGTLICASQEDVSKAVATARSKQKEWAALSFDQRGDYMQKMLQVVLDKQQTIVDTVISETGKATGDAFNMEVFAACDSLSFYSKNAKKMLKTEKKKVHGVLGLAKKVKIVYKPRGVVAIIVPWNGPFILAINPAVQALMAGNTVVIKGSEVTPYSTKLVEELFQEAGLPEGVLQVLLGDGQTGADLVTAGVDKVSFTGSVATGRKVAESCGRQLIPCTLELGGNDAMIVCKDANIKRAAAGALIGSCMNSGHYCCGTERIYVEEEVYDEFLATVTALAKELKQGPQHGMAEDVGAVFWDKQMAIIEDHVADAIANGAKTVVGGKRNTQLEGLYFEPTVMIDVKHDMKIMQEETFGPILCIQKVKNYEEAILLANDSPYGLNGNVWSKDSNKAFDIASRIDTGSVCLNDMAITYGTAEAPFGGVKNSGVGQVNGETGMKGYCHAMPIVIDRFGKADNLAAGYPYSAEKIEGMKKFMNFLWRNPIGRFLLG